MSDAKIYIEGKRNGYAPDQCGKTLTVGELIAILSDFPTSGERLTTLPVQAPRRE